MTRDKIQRRKKSILDCFSMGIQQGILWKGHCPECSDLGICRKIMKLLNKEIK